MKILLLLLLPCLVLAQTKDKILKKESQIREEMLVMTRQLGVSCNTCHNINNFKDDSKVEFKIAKEHIRVVKLINDQGFRGTPKADCFMCHRGELKPNYKEIIKD